jgi:hypothetical protein
MTRSSQSTMAAAVNALGPSPAESDRLSLQSQKPRAWDEQKREDRNG